MVDVQFTVNWGGTKHGRCIFWDIIPFTFDLTSCPETPPGPGLLPPKLTDNSIDLQCNEKSFTALKRTRMIFSAAILKLLLYGGNYWIMPYMGTWKEDFTSINLKKIPYLNVFYLATRVKSMDARIRSMNLTHLKSVHEEAMTKKWNGHYGEHFYLPRSFSEAGR